MNELEIYIDGASKGNPGPSGVGVIICKGKVPVKNISDYIGHATNNVAEYTALIYALEEAARLKADHLRINTDSELLHKQVCRIYKIKSDNIIGLYNRALGLMADFKQVSIRQIPRQENKGADKLAGRAISEALKKNKPLRRKQVSLGKEYIVVKKA